MAAHVATSYTDQVVVSDEIAEFSPEVIAEMNAHVGKVPPDGTVGSDTAAPACRQRERGWIDNPGFNFLRNSSILRSPPFGKRDVLLHVNMRPVGRHHIDLQDAIVQDNG